MKNGTWCFSKKGVIKEYAVNWLFGSFSLLVSIFKLVKLCKCLVYPLVPLSVEKSQVYANKSEIWAIWSKGIYYTSRSIDRIIIIRHNIYIRCYPHRYIHDLRLRQYWSENWAMGSLIISSVFYLLNISWIIISNVKCMLKKEVE